MTRLVDSPPSAMARQGENVSAPVGAQAEPVRGPNDLLREARLRRRVLSALFGQQPSAFSRQHC